MPVGVLLLHGSSGTPDTARANLLRSYGVTVIAPRWFGGPGQPAGICEVPLESFRPPLDELAAAGDSLIIVGTSKGAEAALLLATIDPRIDAVVAMSPSSHVWANVGPGLDGRDSPQRSSWTHGGVPLPFVRYDDSWAPADPELPAFRESYIRSLAHPGTGGAAIPVERFSGSVLLTAGADDQVWPSVEFARRIEERRAAAGLRTRVLLSPAAGHRLVLPGEPVPTGGMTMARGGTPDADRAFGAEVLPALLQVLGADR